MPAPGTPQDAPAAREMRGGGLRREAFQPVRRATPPISRSSIVGAIQCRRRRASVVCAIRPSRRGTDLCPSSRGSPSPWAVEGHPSRVAPGKRAAPSRPSPARWQSRPGATCCPSARRAAMSQAQARHAAGPAQHIQLLDMDPQELRWSIASPWRRPGQASSDSFRAARRLFPGRPLPRLAQFEIGGEVGEEREKRGHHGGLVARQRISAALVFSTICTGGSSLDQVSETEPAP